VIRGALPAPALARGDVTMPVRGPAAPERETAPPELLRRGGLDS